MKITAHFNKEEFDQKPRHGFPRIPYPKEYLPYLRQLCFELEIIRAELNKPIIITSGYRSPIYNKFIGGARFSQHVYGRAADIIVEDTPASEVHEVILELHRQGKIKLGGLGNYEKFTHIDVRPGPLRRWSGSRTNQ